LSTAAGVISDNVVSKFVFTHTSGLAGKIFIDGINEASKTFAAAATGTKTAVQIGSESASLNHLFGHIKNFKIFDVVLTPAQVAHFYVSHLPLLVLDARKHGMVCKQSTPYTSWWAVAGIR